MYKKPGCIAETGGWLGFFLTFFVVFSLFAYLAGDVGPGNFHPPCWARGASPASVRTLDPWGQTIHEPTEGAGEKHAGR